MGKGAVEAEQEEPAPMVTPAGDPLSEMEPPSVQDDAEETWAEDAEEKG